jgi:alpha-tubulin suppressor-like RCC1 family protein
MLHSHNFKLASPLRTLLILGKGSAALSCLLLLNSAASLAAVPMVSAGGAQALIVKADGSVWTTGYQAVGTGDYTGPYTSPGLVSGLAPAKAVAAGNAFFVLKEDGSIWAWGGQIDGALGNGVNDNSNYIQTPAHVAGLPAISKISCTGHCLALDVNGGVWSWGYNRFGQVGNGTTDDGLVPIKVSGLPQISAVYAGGFSSLALDANGNVWSWGNTGSRPVLAPTKRSDITGVTAIAAGVGHNVALMADGTVKAWGGNLEGQLGNGSQPYSDAPVSVSNLSGVTAICASVDHSMALKSDGTVWAWGLNTDGVIGTGTTRTFFDVPIQVVGLSRIVSIACGGTFGFAIDADGVVWGWGDNALGELGDNTLFNRSFPVRMSGPGGTGLFNVLTAQNATNLLPFANGTVSPLRGVAPLMVSMNGSYSGDRDGTIVNYQWFLSNGQVLSGPVASWLFDRAGTFQVILLVTDNSGASSFQPWVVQVDPAVVQVQTGARIDAACNAIGGLRTDGTLFTWGFTNGLGRIVNWQDSVPGTVTGLSGVVGLAFGDGHGLAITSDGKVSGWGGNIAGEVGDGTTTWRSLPVPVGVLSNVTAVAAGGLNSMALRSDGTVWTWGSNAYGQLGLGDEVDRTTPTQVTALAAVKAIAAGQYFSVVVKQDGTVWAWGRNDQGELGDGTRVKRNSPTQVKNLAGIARVWCKLANCFAQANDGTVWGWGFDARIAFGKPAGTADAVPFVMPRLQGFLDFSNTFSTGYGVDAAGYVWGWGTNSSGEIGDGTRVDQPTPVKIAGADNAIAITAPACAPGAVSLRKDGTLVAWGVNDNGTVGDGTLAQRPTPVAVVNETLNGVLDLIPEVANTLPAGRTPAFFTQTTSTSALTDPVLTVDSLAKFNAGDVGSLGSVYVFALAPANIVKGAAAEKSAYFGHSATGATADAPVACVLAQLNLSGQLQAVSAASLQAYVTGVLSAQGQAVTVLNGVSSANIGGATFFLGYGSNATQMFNNGVNRGVVSVPGSISCQPQAPQTGWWWNTAEGGRGYSIEVQGNHLFYASYLYDVSGRATWLITTGNTSLDGSVYNGNLYSFSGGQTLGGPSSGALPPSQIAGAITLAFSDATHGTMIWPGGTVAIERFNIVPNGLTLTHASTEPEGGWWWNPQEPGRGFFLEWQGGELFMAGYMYDDAGRPIWYLSTNTTAASNPQNYSEVWRQFGSGQTLTGGYQPATQINGDVAPVAIRFSGPELGLMTLPNGRSTSIQRFRF